MHSCSWPQKPAPISEGPFHLSIFCVLGPAHSNNAGGGAALTESTLDSLFPLPQHHQEWM